MSLATSQIQRLLSNFKRLRCVTGGQGRRVMFLRRQASLASFVALPMPGCGNLYLYVSGDGKRDVKL